jgi:hypothetical protein
LGPLVLSVRFESSTSTAPTSPKSNNLQQNFRIILRSHNCTKHELISFLQCTNNNLRPNVSQMAKYLCAEIETERFWPVAFPGGSELILQFDEHLISNTYKFGWLLLFFYIKKFFYFVKQT